MRLTALLFLLFCAGLASPLSAQFGLSGFYNINDAKSKVGSAAQDIIYDNAPEIAVHYWFRLNKKRLEFQPTLYYSRTSGDIGWSELGFQFKTNIYPFDFGTDCKCPTFGKQGPQLQKGLFLQLSPGVARHTFRTPDDFDDVSKTTPTIGLGAGLDFGVSNAITLTPTIAWRYTLADFVDYTYTDDIGTVLSGGDNGRLSTLQFGLQATVRLDKKRY